MVPRKPSSARSNAMRARWADPEERARLVAKQSAALKERWTCPQYREKTIARMAAWTKANPTRQRQALLDHYAARDGKGYSLGRERPTTLKSSVHPTKTDLYWAAGFIEGEGSFADAIASRKTPSKYRNSCTQVSAVQVNPEPLHRLLTLFGGNVREVKRKQQRWQRAYVWGAAGARGRGIAMTLYSLMSKKRQGQIRTALGVAQ